MWKYIQDLLARNNATSPDPWPVKAGDGFSFNIDNDSARLHVVYTIQENHRSVEEAELEMINSMAFCLRLHTGFSAEVFTSIDKPEKAE